ncbi:MAG: hypothetical protein R2748_22480 [Bryobacterales bacterium]
MMKTQEMESRLEFLRAELERELRLLEVLTDPEEPTGHLDRKQRKAGVGRILLELGALQMRLLEAEGR